MPDKMPAPGPGKAEKERPRSLPESSDESLAAIQTGAASVLRRARLNPRTLKPRDVLQLQRTIGNQAVMGLLSRKPPEGGTGSSRENRTGLPDELKTGIERLSGMSMDDVRVHYNSPKPAQLQALAYAQGTEIHVGPGQERHLPHEAWHVVQQKQGRVQPRTGGPINDSPELAREADEMGQKALQG